MACFRSLSNCFLMALATLALMAAPARAAIDKAGAEKLRAVVEKGISEFSAHAADSGRTLELDGPVMVEPSGTYYAVTLPGLTITGDDGASTEMGMIAINAMPAAKPGQWKMTLALPTPLSHFNADHELESLTTIGAQNFAGIWHEGMGTFMKLNASYKDIVHMTPERQPIVTVKAATVTSDLTENAKGEWSGPLNIETSGLSLQGDDGSKGSIARLALLSSMTDYSVQAAEDYDAKINALNESYEAGEGEEVSMQHVLGLYNLISAFMGEAWEGFDMTLIAEDVAFSRPADGSKRLSQFGMKSARMGFGMDGFRSNSVSLNIALAYDGLAIAPPPRTMSTTMPDHVKFDISLNKLPFRELTALGRNSIEMMAGASQEGIASLAMMQAVMQAPQLLTAAQSNLTIKDSTFGNKAYDVMMDAMATANMKAMLSATGAATVKIRGIEELTGAIKAQINAKETTPQQKARLQQTLETITIMQVASTKQQAADGQTVHVYNFELAEDGRVMLNGTDMSVLLKKE